MAHDSLAGVMTNLSGRAMTVPLAQGVDGTVILSMPPGMVASRTSIIGYVQDPSSMAIFGAAAIAYR
jgi:hypothetical protein